MPSIQGPPLSLKSDPHGIELTFKDLKVTVHILEDSLVRVFVSPPEAEARSWIVVDSSGDVPYEGRKREDYSRFSVPKVQVAEQVKNAQYSIESNSLLVKINCSTDLNLECHHKQFGCFFKDTKCDAYQYGQNQHGVFRHTIQRQRSDEYYGFGECSGYLNKDKKRIRVDAKDSMGYDAFETDPLYKHWPYHMSRVISDQQKPVFYGLLYDTMKISNV